MSLNMVPTVLLTLPAFGLREWPQALNSTICNAPVLSSACAGGNAAGDLMEDDSLSTLLEIKRRKVFFFGWLGMLLSVCTE